MKYSLLQYQKTQKMGRIGALKGGTLWDFSTFLSQNINKIERGPFEVIKIFSKKSPTMPKKTGRGAGPFSLARYCMLRGKKKNLFDSVR